MGHRALLFKTGSGLFLALERGDTAQEEISMNFCISTRELRLSAKLAKEAARALAQPYHTGALVDLILCEEGCEAVGAFLAAELGGGSVLSLNRGSDIHIGTLRLSEQETCTREELPLRGKSILLLTDLLMSPKRARRAADYILGSGAALSGVCALFGVPGEVEKRKIQCLFEASDLPGFYTWREENGLSDGPLRSDTGK